MESEEGFETKIPYLQFDDADLNLDLRECAPSRLPFRRKSLNLIVGTFTFANFTLFMNFYVPYICILSLLSYLAGSENRSIWLILLSIAPTTMIVGTFYYYERKSLEPCQILLSFGFASFLLFPLVIFKTTMMRCFGLDQIIYGGLDKTCEAMYNGSYGTPGRNHTYPVDARPMKKGFDLNGLTCVIYPLPQRTYNVQCNASNFGVAFVEAGILEELLKYIAIRVFFTSNRVADPSALVGYTLAAANGFALVENIQYILLFSSSNPAVTGLIRGILAVPLHSLTGLIIGCYLARRKFLNEYYPVWKVLLVPVLAHGIYDFIAFNGDAFPGSEFVLLLIVFCTTIYARFLFLGFENVPRIQIREMRKAGMTASTCESCLYSWFSLCFCCSSSKSIDELETRMKHRAASIFQAQTYLNEQSKTDDSNNESEEKGIS